MVVHTYPKLHINALISAHNSFTQYQNAGIKYAVNGLSEKLNFRMF